HNMSDGSMFGTLQSMYSTEEGFQTYSEIVVYLPESELHYQVFAAVPYSDIHILYNYDFENSRQSSAFFDSVFAVRTIGAQFSGDTEIGTEDCVLILSTCLQGDNSSRYLVLAKLYETVSP
ncbi:MAG: class B sortase, partial [Oscillospiraceae bacterium]|nr:class B sortase [Oscillospiraceae bacterium]